VPLPEILNRHEQEKTYNYDHFPETFNYSYFESDLIMKAKAEKIVNFSLNYAH
jgi:hypothetical protein